MKKITGIAGAILLGMATLAAAGPGHDHGKHEKKTAKAGYGTCSADTQDCLNHINGTAVVHRHEKIDSLCLHGRQLARRHDGSTVDHPIEPHDLKYPHRRRGGPRLAVGVADDADPHGATANASEKGGLAPSPNNAKPVENAAGSVPVPLFHGG